MPVLTASRRASGASVQFAYPPPWKRKPTGDGSCLENSRATSLARSTRAASSISHTRRGAADGPRSPPGVGLLVGPRPDQIATRCGVAWQHPAPGMRRSLVQIQPPRPQVGSVMASMFVSKTNGAGSNPARSATGSHALCHLSAKLVMITRRASPPSRHRLMEKVPLCEGGD